MDILNNCMRQGGFTCCNKRGPSEVCLTSGCNSRLICEVCKQNHPTEHKSIALKDYLQANALKKERSADPSAISEKDFEKEISLVIHQTENLSKTLKKTQKSFENWRMNARDSFYSFGPDIEQLLSKSPSRITNGVFSKVYDMIAAAKIGQTENFLPDIPAEEWMLILRYGEKFTQDFREVVEKMLPEIDKKSPVNTVDGLAIKPKLQPFVEKHIKTKSSRQVNDIFPEQAGNEEKKNEEKKAQESTRHRNDWQEEYRKLQDKVGKQQLEIGDIEVLIKKAAVLPTVLTLQEYKELEYARSEYMRLEKWYHDAKYLKQALLKDVEKFKEDEICKQPQHPGKPKKPRDRGLQNKLLKQNEEKFTLNGFEWHRNDIKRYGFKFWGEFQENFKAEEQYINKKGKEANLMQLELSKDYETMRTEFLTQFELVIREEDFGGKVAKFLQVSELFQELKNFVLYLNSLDKGTKEYAMGIEDENYLFQFPQLHDAENLQERIQKSGVRYPREFTEALGEQISLAAVLKMYLGNQDFDSHAFEEFIKASSCAKLNFGELKEAKKKFLWAVAENSERKNKPKLSNKLNSKDDMCVKIEERADVFSLDDEDDVIITDFKGIHNSKKF